MFLLETMLEIFIYVRNANKVEENEQIKCACYTCVERGGMISIDKILRNAVSVNVR